MSKGDIVVVGAGHGSPYSDRNEVAYDVATASENAPDAIRTAANESSSNIDHYDFDLGGSLLGNSPRRLVDAGNLRLSSTDGPENRRLIQSAITEVLIKGGTPFLLGGDDSVPIPFLAAFRDNGPVDILQIDAHIDWRDSIGGERDGYSSTMRRASEHPFVRSITQIGMRGVGSARQQEVDIAHDWGANLLTVAKVRAIGAQGVIDKIPQNGSLIIQIDCDAFDTSVCPAVNAPTPGGFQFDEVMAVVQSVIAARGMAGFSIVELNPSIDSNMISATVAARITCNAIGSLARTSISPTAQRFQKR
ncbi:arginase family protein [uncultured Roseobacter sp.]|uniref:arginase family protein n=1 Tax=uncultured Roseobacter sp. TaxID=114847 RepID=UPI002612F6A9|nr:arginase family protein [uncultured Roseobacter sp.]